MRLHRRRGHARLGLCALALAFAPAAPAGAQDEKIPITTRSKVAREEYLKGRDLFERLRGTDARAHFEKAAAADKDFALARLGLANSAPSAKAFFAALEQAAALAARASQGERHLILGFDAGVRGDPVAQKKHFDALVAAYPRDERALNQLGVYHFGRQEYADAIAAYQKAIRINASFSPPYNQMGYSYRFLGRDDEAEKAFKKYIELIPDDPNPYDSYAELLMKMGRFDESIAMYEKALALNPRFVPSYVGIGLNRIYQGQPARARETFARLEQVARNAGEKRQAYAQEAASYLHEGNTAEALRAVDKMRAVARAENDLAALSGDANLAGNILLEAGRADEAAAQFAEALKLAEQANTPPEVKEAARRQELFNSALVALARADAPTARRKAQEYAAAVAGPKVPFEVRQSHELNGRIALQENDGARAADELLQANQLDPRVLYYLAQAQRARGDAAAARETARRAAEHNGLNFNYAYVRDKARQLLAQL
jgi:tetratricopeptide (TPR) repeat protein